MENNEVKEKDPFDKLEEFKKKLEEATNEEWCSNSSILDWLMQRDWSKHIKYLSYPDKEEHIVYDGLKQVFEFLSNISYQIDKNKSIYNGELLRCYMEIESLKKGVDSTSSQKLEKIKKILES